MGLVVQKYGGTSVADIEKIKRVAKRVAATKAEGNNVIVVVSAMGKMTDELVDLANQISASPDDREFDMLLSTGEQISVALLAMGMARGLHYFLAVMLVLLVWHQLVAPSRIIDTRYAAVDSLAVYDDDGDYSSPFVAVVDNVKDAVVNIVAEQSSSGYHRDDLFWRFFQTPKG